MRVLLSFSVRSGGALYVSAEGTLTNRRLYRRGMEAGDPTVELAVSRCVGACTAALRSGGAGGTCLQVRTVSWVSNLVANKTGTWGDVVGKCQDIGSGAGLRGSGKLPHPGDQPAHLRAERTHGKQQVSARPAATVSRDAAAPGSRPPSRNRAVSHAATVRVSSVPQRS